MKNKQNEQKQAKYIGSVLKATDILELLPTCENGYSVTEISTHLNQGVSATYHILNTLKSRDFVMQDKHTKKYKLGPAFLRLAPSNSKVDMIKDISRDYLQQLTDLFNETSNLVILQGNEIEYIYQVESTQLLKMFTQLGARVPFYCTGGGKAIFAYKSPEAQKSILEGTDFTRYTKNTLVTSEELMDEAQKIRSRGFALDSEEREIGVTCVAAPIFDNTASPVAAVSISSPTYRLNPEMIEKITLEVKRAAGEISASLGFSG